MEKSKKVVPLKAVSLELEPILSARLGWITKIELDSNQIWVDYEENPLGHPQLALLEINFSLEELKNALSNIKALRVVFFNGDPERPIIRDIFYSITDRQEPVEDPYKTVHVKSETLILEGTKKLIIKSGGVECTFDAVLGELSFDAENIRSNAKNNYKIKGGSTTLN